MAAYTPPAEPHFRRTKNGEWVVMAPTSQLPDGTTEITVRLKNGEKKQVEIAHLGKKFAARGRYYRYGYLPDSRAGSRRDCECGIHRYYRVCQTGGQCSSMGTGRSCGGCDCDGY